MSPGEPDGRMEGTPTHMPCSNPPETLPSRLSNPSGLHNQIILGWLDDDDNNNKDSNDVPANRVDFYCRHVCLKSRLDKFQQMEPNCQLSLSLAHPRFLSLPSTNSGSGSGEVECHRPRITTTSRRGGVQEQVPVR